MAHVVTLLALLLLSFNSQATALPVDNQSAELAISVEARNVSDRYLYATINNGESRAIYCAVTFYNGPQTLRVRKASIEASQQRKFIHYPQRRINQPTIRVACEPA